MQPETGHPVQGLNGRVVAEDALAAQFELDEEFHQAGHKDAPEEHKPDVSAHARGDQKLAGAYDRAGDHNARPDVAQQPSQAFRRLANSAGFACLHVPVLFCD